MSQDQRGKSSPSQINRYEREHSRDEHHQLVENEVPVKQEWKKTVLKRPPETYQSVPYPTVARECCKPRGEVPVVRELLCYRPDRPPDQQRIEDAPKR